MKTGNSLSTVAAGLSAELTLHDAPPKSQFDGLGLKIKYPFTVAVAPVVGDAAMLLKILKAAVGSFLLEYGPAGARVSAYNSANGGDLQNVHRFIRRNIPTNNVIGTTFAIGARVAEITLLIPFSIPWLHGEKKRPGTTQVRGIKLKVVENELEAITNVTRTGGAQVVREIEYLNRPGPDIHAQILSLSREQSPRKDLKGPDGLTIAAWLTNSKAADTTLTAFKVAIADVLVHDVQTPAVIAAEFDEIHQDVGGGTLTDTVTPIYAVDDGEEIEELVHGPLTLEMANQDIASVQCHVLHYPALGETQAKAETIHAANTKQAPVLLTVLERKPFAHPGAASVANRRLVTPSDARFVTEPGLVATPGAAEAVPSVPEHIAAAAEAGASAVASQGAHVSEAVARRVQKLTSLRVGGVTTSAGKGVGAIRSVIRGGFRRAFKR